jgi:hypothetical protein
MSDGDWESLSPLLIGDYLLYFAAEISVVNGVVLIDIRANTKERSVKIVRPIEESVGMLLDEFRKMPLYRQLLLFFCQGIPIIFLTVQLSDFYHSISSSSWKSTCYLLLPCYREISHFTKRFNARDIIPEN